MRSAPPENRTGQVGSVVLANFLNVNFGYKTKEKEMKVVRASLRNGDVKLGIACLPRFVAPHKSSCRKSDICGKSRYGGPGSCSSAKKIHRHSQQIHSYRSSARLRLNV